MDVQANPPGYSPAYLAGQKKKFGHDEDVEKSPIRPPPETPKPVVDFVPVSTVPTVAVVHQPMADFTGIERKEILALLQEKYPELMNQIKLGNSRIYIEQISAEPYQNEERNYLFISNSDGDVHSTIRWVIYLTRRGKQLLKLPDDAPPLAMTLRLNTSVEVKWFKKSDPDNNFFRLASLIVGYVMTYKKFLLSEPGWSDLPSPFSIGMPNLVHYCNIRIADPFSVKKTLYHDSLERVVAISSIIPRMGKRMKERTDTSKVPVVPTLREQMIELEKFIDVSEGTKPDSRSLLSDSEYSLYRQLARLTLQEFIRVHFKNVPQLTLYQRYIKEVAKRLDEHDKNFQSIMKKFIHQRHGEFTLQSMQQDLWMKSVSDFQFKMAANQKKQMKKQKELDKATADFEKALMTGKENGKELKEKKEKLQKEVKELETCCIDDLNFAKGNHMYFNLLEVPLENFEKRLCSILFILIHNQKIDTAQFPTFTEIAKIKCLQGFQKSEEENLDDKFVEEHLEDSEQFPVTREVAKEITHALRKKGLLKQIEETTSEVLLLLIRVEKLKKISKENAKKLALELQPYPEKEEEKKFEKDK